jgi:hypothetical protein
MVNTTQARVYIKVLSRDSRNTLSRNMAAKFFNPAKVIVLKPSQFIKLRIKEKNTGISTKIKNPIKLGSIKDIPTKVFLRERDKLFFPVTGMPRIALFSIPVSSTDQTLI